MRKKRKSVVAHLWVEGYVEGRGWGQIQKSSIGRRAAAGLGLGQCHASQRTSSGSITRDVPLGEDGLDEGGVLHLGHKVVEVVLHARELWSLL